MTQKKEDLKEELRKMAKYIDNNRVQEAVIGLARISALAESLEYEGVYTESIAYLMKALYFVQEYKLVIKYGRSINVKNIKEMKDMIVYYTYMGHSFVSIGNYKAANDYYEELGMLGNKRAKYLSYIGRGLMKDKNRETAAAIELLLKAREYADNDQDYCYLYNNLAELSINIGSSEALDYAKYAIEKARKDSEKALTYNTLGYCLLKVGQLDGAAEALEEGQQYIVDDDTRLGYNLRWLGEVYKDQKKYSQAIKTLEEALRYLTEKDILRVAAECCWELFSIYKNKDKKSADKYKIKAESFLKAIDLV